MILYILQQTKKVKIIDFLLFLIIIDLFLASKQFVSIMEQGHPDYGCYANPAKTKLSFAREVPDDATQQPGPGCIRAKGKEFSWKFLRKFTRWFCVSSMVWLVD